MPAFDLSEAQSKIDAIRDPKKSKKIKGAELQNIFALYDGVSL